MNKTVWHENATGSVNTLIFTTMAEHGSVVTEILMDKQKTLILYITEELSNIKQFNSF